MVTVLLVVFIGAVIMTNTFYLDEYYIYKSKDVFINEFRSIENNTVESMDELERNLHARNTRTGFKYVLFTEKSDIEYVSSPEFKRENKEKLQRSERDLFEKNMTDINSKEIIFDVMRDRKNEKSQIRLLGKLQEDRYLLIIQPIEHVQKNADIANEFLMYIGLVFLVVSIVISFFMSRQMVKPVLEITSITEKIANLDFTSRYNGDSKDEVGILGQNINVISEKLDQTIENLRASNDQLQKEMNLQKRLIE